MAPHVLLLVLAAAVMHAAWNALVKVAGDRLFTMAVVMFTHTVLALPIVISLGPPDRAAWFWIILSAITHLFYYFAVINQYRLGDLSHVYPISRGVAPLLVYLIAYLGAGETLTNLGLLAVVVISLGILALALPGHRQSAVTGQATFSAIATGVLIACYTFVDGIGGRTDGEVLRYIAWLFLIEGFPLTVVVLVRRSPDELRAAWRLIGAKSVLGGVLSTAAYALVIWAMSIAPMAAVSALRESSVIFAALIGTYLMKERMGPRRIAASVAVTAGVVILQLAGGD